MSMMADPRENPLTEATTVLGGRLAKETVNAVSDEFSRRILASTLAQGKTVQEISLEQAVPLSTCYRRAHELMEGGLLVPERIVLTPDGKRFTVFRSAFKKVQIVSDLADTSVSVELNPEVAAKFRQTLFRLSYQGSERPDKKEHVARPSASRASDVDRIPPLTR